MRRSTLILSLALALSVAGNLLVAGLFLGHGFSGGHGHRRGDVSNFMDRFLWAVPDELRGDIRERLRADRERMHSNRNAIRTTRTAVNEALRARPFDRAAAETALDSLRSELQSAQTHFHSVVLDAMEAAQAAGTLPPPPERPEKPEREGVRGKPQ